MNRRFDRRTRNRHGLDRCAYAVADYPVGQSITRKPPRKKPTRGKQRMLIVDPPITTGTKTKRCGRCGEYKALGAFNRNRRLFDGLDNSCRRCVQKKQSDGPPPASMPGLRDINEIADILGIGRSAAHQRLKKAEASLRRAIAKQVTAGDREWMAILDALDWNREELETFAKE